MLIGIIIIACLTPISLHRRYPAASDAGCAAFARLEALFLGSCKLTDWKRVSELDKCAAMF